MDITQMIAAHRKNRADITIAALEVPAEEATRFGVFTVDDDARVIAFTEKPEVPEPIPGRETCFASMGNYIFDYWAIDHAVLSNEDAIRYAEIMKLNATVGASGAIMGVLVAFGYSFPNTQLFIFPIPVPVKAKWAILGIIGLDIFGGFSSAANDNIAHFAHIGGAAVGFLLVLIWNKTNKQSFLGFPL